MDNLRYLNKQTNASERYLISNWWKEQISIKGQEVMYYVNNTSLSAANQLYGEQPMAGFEVPKPLIVYLNLNNDAIMLSKFGLVADGEVASVIHPEMFTAVFGVSAEPKAGDVVVLSEYGSDRLGFPKRGATVYEITEAIDEFKVNALGGHYVWFWSAKRCNYSFEPTAPGPGVGNITHDDNDIIEEHSTQEHFDYIVDNPDSRTSVYGNY